MPRPTVARIDLGAYRRNYRKLKNVIATDCKFMAVVKANAYGHGLIEISKEAENLGADYLGVALVEEGLAIRKSGVKTPILMMGSTSTNSFADAIKNDICMTMYNITSLIKLNSCAKKLNKTAKIHLKIDTGMNRLGLRSNSDIIDMMDCITGLKHCELAGVFTHVATSGDYLSDQYERFLDAKKIIDSYDCAPVFHMANSLSAINYPKTHFDMVRFGIATFGYAPVVLPEVCLKTEPVMSICTKMTNCFSISSGESVGYGRDFTAQNNPTKIATIPIGYADGYKRAFSNIAFALVNGKRVRVAGNVCMDQSMLDITNSYNTELDYLDYEVVLLGKSGDESINADELANIAGTISYEILTGISPRVRREYFR